LIINNKVPPPSEPRAEQRPFVRNLHGIRLTDEYAWLKAPNWREVMRDPQQLDPAIRAYLQAENGYCEHALADNAVLQEALFAEMKGRIKEDDSTVPDPDGAYAYYLRYRKDGQHPLLCREPRNGGAEQLLLDGDALARGKPFFDSAPWAIRPTIGCSRGRPTNPAPSSTLLVCA
jgi:oligopeptidase B